MFFELTNNLTYTASGNSFSRAFLLAENLKDTKNLLVFDTKKEAETFANILSFIAKENVYPVLNLAQAVDFFGRENGWFVTTKELFEAGINWKYHVEKNSFSLY